MNTENRTIAYERVNKINSIRNGLQAINVAKMESNKKMCMVHYITKTLFRPIERLTFTSIAINFVLTTEVSRVLFL